MKKLFARIPAPLAILLLMSIPHLLYALSFWYKIPFHLGASVGPTDPDPWLRLHLVREWLVTGDWYNHLVPRANTPFAEPTSPWSRPLDVVIAVPVKLQPADVDLNLKLMRAALLLPWIWMTLLLAGIFRILRRTSPAPVTYLMAAFFIAMMPIVWNYFGLANADHHAPLAVLFIWAMGGVLNPAATRGALVISGILLGIMLWMSMEAAILIALIYGWFGLEWLRGSRLAAKRLASIATSVAFTSLVALMLERPSWQWFDEIYDANSIVYVTLMTFDALIAWQMAFTRSHRLVPRLLVATASAATMFGIFLYLFPTAAQGPLANVTPFIIQEFLPRITEVKPLYKAELLNILASLIQPAAAGYLMLTALMHSKRRFYTAGEIRPLAFFCASLFLLYVTQQRWGYYAYPILAIPLAPVLASLFEPHSPAFNGRWPATTMRLLPESRQLAIRLSVIIGLIMFPLALLFLQAALNSPARNNSLSATANARRDYCYALVRAALRSGTLDTINGSASRALLLPTDLAADVLFFTKHRIVAGNYHREGDAIEYAWHSTRITDSEVLLGHLARRNMEAILICPSADPENNSILEAIADGATPPEWMTPVAVEWPKADARTKNKDYRPLEDAEPRLFLVSHAADAAKQHSE